VVATALLLPAVPVSAITFLTPWNVVQTKRSSGAPEAKFKFDFAGPGTLSIDMGRTSSNKAKSRVEATRTFHVGPGGETVNFSHGFETLLEDARVKVKFKIKPRSNFENKKWTFDAGEDAPETFTLNDSIVGLLKAGDYQVKVTVDYKNKEGEWDNTLPRPGSPHTFAIRSL
jgi:hypothetical protein